MPKRKLVSALMVLVLLVPMLLAVQSGFADPIVSTPTGVDGRILTTDKTGDTSDWVEIAVNSDYSLIVRKNYINVNQYSGTQNVPSWQYVSYGSSASYTSSNVRAGINAWFNGTAAGAADRLSATAKLRNYTVQNTAMSSIGTCCSQQAMSDGLSKPTSYQVGTGNDIAFALSYAESANFFSSKHFMRYTNPAEQPSQVVAVLNIAKINIPLEYLYGMWLRSPGDCPGTAGSLSNQSNAGGVCFQFQITSPNASEKGLVYPALWVNSDIFGAVKGTVIVSHSDAATGAVWSTLTYDVPAPGNYGPYPALDIPGYRAYLAQNSDPASGYINPGETKHVRWMYEKIQANATINVMYLDVGSYALLDWETFSVPAGNYGPYTPKAFEGYSAGQLLSGSAPASGVVGSGESKTIIFAYTKEAVAINTVTVIHQTTGGQVLDVEDYTVPLGSYGPYYAKNYTGYYPGFWDSSSDPIYGEITTNGTSLVIRYIYISQAIN